MIFQFCGALSISREKEWSKNSWRVLYIYTEGRKLKQSPWNSICKTKMVGVLLSISVNSVLGRPVFGSSRPAWEI